MKNFDTPSAGSGRKKTFSSTKLRALQPLVMADFMRALPGQNQPKAGMQNTIARMLMSWLELALLRNFDQAPALALWDDEDPDSLPVAGIYANHDIDPSVAGWIRIYRATPTDDDITLIRPHVEGRLVIGFELSPFQCALFDRLEVPYISLAIHPLRFMQDYTFMLFSNFADLDAIRPLGLSQDDIAFAAQLKMADMRRRAQFELAENSAVLFGQVDIDASLIGPSGIISLQHHIETVRQFCADYDTVYFKPHPYAPNNIDLVRVLRQFGNIEFVTHNPYALLAARQVDTVAALTSSVLTEATYFGKTARALSSLWVNRAEEPAFGIGILSPQFWKVLLASVNGGETDRIAAVPRDHLSDVTVKSLLNISWETHGTTEVPTSGKQVKLDQTMIFGLDQEADTFCLGDGWKPPSHDHRWAGPRGAFLSFRLPPGTASDFFVNLKISAMASEQNPVLVQLFCQECILTEETLISGNVTTLDFALPAKMFSALGDVEIEVVSSHAHSPHFLKKLPSMQAMSSDMRALSVAVRALQVSSTKKALLLSVGETLKACDILAGTPFMPYGWHQPEPDGIWTNGRNSLLSVTTAPIPDEDLLLTLGNVRAFLTDILPGNTLIVRVNGRQCITHKFHQMQQGDLRLGGIDIDVPISRASLCDEDGIAQINLEMVACHSPKLAGISEDARPIGLMIESFTLESVIRAHARKPSEHIANIIGPFNIHTGLAIMTRNSFLAVQDAMDEFDVKLTKPALLGPKAINFNNSLHQDNYTDFVKHQHTGSEINVFFGDVSRVAKIVNNVGNDILRDRYNICYGAWELEILPTYLADTRNIDEYWALSTFIADAASKRMNVPVHAIPIPVDLHFPEALAPRNHFGIPEDKFAFLFNFSVDSTMARKNPEAVLEAFEIAFPDPVEPVALVIKSTIRQASTANRKAFDAFKARACKDPRIILVEDTLSRDDNASLYMCSDAYISLHRAEGFGLTMAEAMGYGKPTIGTGYSGNLDFMNTDNACLVRYDKVEMDPQDYHNQQGEWADPDTDDAAQYMRRVYSDIPFREKIARAGQRMIHEKFSRIAIGRKLLKRLQEIHEERS